MDLAGDLQALTGAAGQLATQGAKRPVAVGEAEGARTEGQGAMVGTQAAAHTLSPVRFTGLIQNSQVDPAV